MRNWAWAIMAASISVTVTAQENAPRPVMVFFDWGKPDIRSDDQAVLDEVAANWKNHPDARLVIAGHSDRSGPSGPNLRSSKKRAETVQDYLVANGVPERAMILEAYGEQRPIVQTEDGVREVQNRRVEIRLIPAG